MPAKSWSDTQIISALRNGVKTIVSSFALADLPETEQGEFPLQRHYNREILIVLYGESEFALEGHRVHLSPGTAVLIDNWQQHSAYYRDHDRHLIHIWVHFLSNTATAYVDYVAERKPGNKSRLIPCGNFAFSEDISKLLISRWDKIGDLAAAGEAAAAEEYMKSMIQFVMEEMLMNYILPIQDETVTDSSKKVSFARNYIETHNGKDCSLDRLAMITNCSKYHLVHLFKEYTGKTPGDYINEARLRYTKAALSYGLRKKEIADNLGFASPSAFGNWEKRFKNTAAKTRD